MDFLFLGVLLAQPPLVCSMQLFQTLSTPTQLSAVGAHEIDLFETSVYFSIYR